MVNTRLKFELLNESKPYKLLNFKSDPVLRVYIPKADGKLIPHFGAVIPTLRDRYIQVIMLLILEPYMEPLGDRLSFGFRPGRDANFNY